MTNQLRIEFKGICVHFSRENNAGLDLPAAHRVVMPYVPDDLEWGNWTIHPHTPTLTLPGGQPSPLLFATLSLDPLTSPQSVSTTGMLCIPSLTAIYEQMAVVSAVVTGKTSYAGLYFDLDEGQLSSFNENGCAAVVATIDTEAESARLHITPWNQSEQATQSDISLSTPKTIVISNMASADAEMQHDQMVDFVLSFAVGQLFPPPVGIYDKLGDALGGVATCVRGLTSHAGFYGDLGSGCSNSHFP